MRSENFEPLRSDCFYHIYNRGNNKERLFYEQRNYVYFLRLWAHYIQPVAHTYAYALLGNHFHFLVKMKSLLAAPTPDRMQQPARCTLSQPFSNFFNAYAKSINKAYGRTGSLFQERFRRKYIAQGPPLRDLVLYIHNNPQIHGFTSDFKTWRHSSYHGLLGSAPTQLMREEVLQWFGGRTGFISFHEAYPGVRFEKKNFLELESDD